MSEGFYFRHDSIKNPQYERFLQYEEKNKGLDKKITNETLLKGDIEDTILEKMKF